MVGREKATRTPCRLVEVMVRSPPARRERCFMPSSPRWWPWLVSSLLASPWPLSWTTPARLPVFDDRHGEAVGVGVFANVGECLANDAVGELLERPGVPCVRYGDRPFGVHLGADLLGECHHGRSKSMLVKEIRMQAEHQLAGPFVAAASTSREVSSRSAISSWPGPLASVIIPSICRSNAHSTWMVSSCNSSARRARSSS